MYKVGKLDQKITFYREVETSDGQGGVDIIDTVIADMVWASVRPASGKEIDRFDKLNSEELCVFETRRLDSVVEKDKINYRGEWYNIRWKPRVSSRHLYDSFYAERGVAQ